MRGARLARCLAAVAAVGAVVAVTGSSVVAAAGTREGDVTIVDISGSYGPLVRGGSATEFSLRLPNDASCPGDSMHDQWRAQTFLVPAGVDPTTLTYELNQPKGQGNFALYADTTRPLTQILLRPNDVAGQPGYFDAFPPMSFAVFTPGLLKDGTYTLGVACTYFRETAKVWDTKIVITSSPTDRPAGFVWRAASVPASSQGSDGFPSVALAVAGFAVVLLVVVAVSLLRHFPTRRTRTLAKESP